MDKVSISTSYVFLIMLNNLSAATFRCCVLFESKILRGGFIISFLLKSHVMNCNNFACGVLGGGAKRDGTVGCHSVSNSDLPKQLPKRKRKPGARRKECFQLILEECILM